MSKLSNFVEDQNEETLEIVEAGLVWNKDPFLQIQKDEQVPTVQLGHAEANVEEGGDEEEDVPIISIVEARKSKRKTSKPDLKGKGVAFSSKKPKKKSMLRINEVLKRKRKFLLESTIAAKKAKVDF